MKTKPFIKCLSGIFLCLFLICSEVQSEVIFQDNFDGQEDWTREQPTSGGDTCWSDCNVPSGWTAHYNGYSYCPGGPGHNNMYINSTNALGNQGKGLTFWDESCTDSFEDSDGNLGKILDQIYDEIYIRFYIKFQPGYQWQEGGAVPQHKFWHIDYYSGIGSPYQYFGNDHTQPGSSGGFKTYNGNVWYYVGYRCEESYYCQGSPSYNFDVGTDSDHVDLGPISNLCDGQWHSVELYYKMNTNDGSTFNANGIHRFWLDGELKYETNNIPFSDNGSDVNPRRGWKVFSVGGNNSNRWTTSCNGTGCEQWYAIDDVVLETAYIGPLDRPEAPQNIRVIE